MSTKQDNGIRRSLSTKFDDAFFEARQLQKFPEKLKMNDTKFIVEGQPLQIVNSMYTAVCAFDDEPKISKKSFKMKFNVKEE